MKKCSLVCEKCGARLSISSVDGYTLLSCAHCGSSFELLDEDPSVRQAWMAADVAKSGQAMTYRMHRDHMDRDLYLLRVKIIAAVLLAVLLIGLIIFASVRQSHRVSLPISARDAQGKHYTTVVYMLKDAGLEHIDLVQTRDLRDTIFHNCSGDVGKVDRITVDGNGSFWAGTWVDRDAVIRIWYKTYSPGR